MAYTAHVLTDTRLYAGGCDLTAYSNKVDLSLSAEVLDRTTFASDGNKEVKAGDKTADISASGFFEAGSAGVVDDAMWAEFGGGDTPWSCGPSTADVGDLAWVLRTLQTQYKLLGPEGQLAPYEAAGKSKWPAARGVFLHASSSVRTTTGTGTAVEHVAIPAGSYGYASLHVLSISGSSTPSITVKVQSDDNSGFSSATDRITFSAATAVGGQSGRVAGAVTDTYWRAQFAITGSSPSFLFVVAFGVA